MIKIEKIEKEKDLRKYVSYGRLFVIKFSDTKWGLTVYFPYNKDRSDWTVYVLAFFKSKDELLYYVKNEIDKVYEINLKDKEAYFLHTKYKYLGVIKNFKLDNGKLKTLEVKSKLGGWKPYIAD